MASSGASIFRFGKSFDGVGNLWGRSGAVKNQIRGEDISPPSWPQGRFSRIGGERVVVGEFESLDSHGLGSDYMSKAIQRCEPEFI